MAPSRIKMPKSSTQSYQINELPPRQQTVAIKSSATTPSTVPRTRIIGITQGQKQALIDNLQLEVTERARKLRAQYALQAQSLRTRIELRINRIPTSLRSEKMGELFTKYMEIMKPEQCMLSSIIAETKPSSKALPLAMASSNPEGLKTVVSTQIRGTKRKSDDMESADKENVVEHLQALPNPKKRTKVATGARTRQATNPSTILSPKSSNSRTLPHSPIRPPLGSPQKSYMSHPASPLKSMLPPKSASPAKATAITAVANLASVTVDKTKPARAKANSGRKTTNPVTTAKPAAARPKRGVLNALVESRSVSNSSNASNTSTGTTILKKGRPATTATSAATKKKNLIAGGRAMGKKAHTMVEAPPAERRVLRKRA